MYNDTVKFFQHAEQELFNLLHKISVATEDLEDISKNAYKLTKYIEHRLLDVQAFKASVTHVSDEDN